MLKSDGLEHRRPTVDRGFDDIPWKPDGPLARNLGRCIGADLFGLEHDSGLVLERFPRGYAYCRIKRKNGRTDSYIYGALYCCRDQDIDLSVFYVGGPAPFKSAPEFAPHLVWLMRGAPEGACACRRCQKASR